jgi:hypothetical protein
MSDATADVAAFEEQLDALLVECYANPLRYVETMWAWGEGELVNEHGPKPWQRAFLLDLGGFTPFFYAFDDREKILDILEMATGERLTYDYFRFGGVDHDVPAADQ